MFAFQNLLHIYINNIQNNFKKHPINIFTSIIFERRQCSIPCFQKGHSFQFSIENISRKRLSKTNSEIGRVLNVATSATSPIFQFQQESTFVSNCFAASPTYSFCLHFKIYKNMHFVIIHFTNINQHRME